MASKDAKLGQEIKTHDLERFVNFSHQELEDLINLANFDWNKYIKKEEKTVQTYFNFE